MTEVTASDMKRVAELARSDREKRREIIDGLRKRRIDQKGD